MTATVDLILADLNGDHYLGTQEGETLVNKEANKYYIPFGMAVARNPLEKVAISKDSIEKFLAMNATTLMATDPSLSLKDAAIIAYHRLFAVKNGLVSPLFLPATYFVNYDEVIQFDDKKTDDAMNDKATKSFLAVAAEIDLDTRKIIKETFTDRVCLVAFVFRARGHHFMDAYQELYTRVWGKCRYKPDDLKITFQHLATYAFHAIFPIILDAFWDNAVRESHANGALCKRFDVAPAGMAGPAVLRQGVQDLLMIAPGIRNRLEEAMTYLDDLNNQMLANRFNGSVNARYYNAKRIAVDEKRLSAIAATIYAAVRALAPEAPIANSPALVRIANNAPITGAVLGRAIGTIANREEVVNPLLVERPIDDNNA